MLRARLDRSFVPCLQLMDDGRLACFAVPVDVDVNDDGSGPRVVVAVCSSRGFQGTTDSVSPELDFSSQPNQ